MAHTLTHSQQEALRITEQVGSSLSLLGFLFVVYTYLFCEGFKKPVNRLIFYASWSNLGTTIVGFIALHGVAAGQNSALCQFQAFLFQMFGGVDVYWALCMSLNVYLALFHGWTTKRMQSVDLYYLGTCYGFSLVPAIVYLFVKNEAKGRVYGPAILWCWIAPKWSPLRIATLYAIVWVSLFGALSVYCIALYKAWHYRRSLVGLLNPLNENPFATMGVTTEIEVVYTSASDRRSTATATYGDHIALAPTAHPLDIQERGQPKTPYSVNVQGADPNGMIRSRPDLLRLPTLTRNAALAEENAEAWLYARIAFLYFLAMMICWIPASINRLLSVIQPDRLIFGLNYAAIVGLPLQGFLNALVYYVSSQTAIKRLFTRRSRRERVIRHGTPEQRYTRDLEGGAGAGHGSTRDMKPSAPFRMDNSHTQQQFQFGFDKAHSEIRSVPRSQAPSKSTMSSVDDLHHGTPF